MLHRNTWIVEDGYGIVTVSGRKMKCIKFLIHFIQIETMQNGNGIIHDAFHGIHRVRKCSQITPGSNPHSRGHQSLRVVNNEYPRTKPKPWYAWSVTLTLYRSTSFLAKPSEFDSIKFGKIFQTRGETSVYRIADELADSNSHFVWHFIMAHRLRTNQREVSMRIRGLRCPFDCWLLLEVRFRPDSAIDN